MNVIDNMTKDEKSLLMYLETRVVDYAGRVDTKHMNKEELDKVIPSLRNKNLLSEFGRIKFEDVSAISTHYVKLTELGYQVSAQLRKEKAERTWQNRSYRTTAQAS